MFLKEKEIQDCSNYQASLKIEIGVKERTINQIQLKEVLPKDRGC